MNWQAWSHAQAIVIGDLKRRVATLASENRRLRASRDLWRHRALTAKPRWTRRG